MVARFQLFSELPEVIDFTVEDDCDCSGFVPDRLAAAGQVDDAKATHTGGHTRFQQDSFFVGSAVNDSGEHAADNALTVCLGVQSDDAANSTHEI